MPRSLRYWIARCLREPLCHFLLIGGGFFLMYALMNGSSTDTVSLPEQTLENYKQQYEGVYQKPATQKAINEFKKNWLRDEVLYREGMKQNILADDPITRQRVITLMQQNLTQEVNVSLADEQQLKDFMEQNLENYKTPALISFSVIDVQQISLNNGMERGRFVGLIKKALNNGADPNQMDLPVRHYSEQPTAALQALAGENAIEKVLQEEIGQWQFIVEGPKQQLLQINQYQDPSTPSFDQIKDQLQRDWLRQNRQHTSSIKLQELTEKYGAN